MIVVFVDELAKTPYSALSSRTLLRIEVSSAANTKMPNSKPVTVNPLTLTPRHRVARIAEVADAHAAERVTGRLHGGAEPTSEMSEVVMDTDSTYVPRSTRIVSPGLAASTAAWIDSPGRTMCVEAAAAGPATTVPRLMAVVNPMTDASARRRVRVSCM